MAIIEGLIVNAITEIIGIAGKKFSANLERNEKIIKIIEKIGLEPGKPKNDFESVYVHALVEYGVGRSDSVLKIFRDEDVIETFRKAWQDGAYQKFEGKIFNAIDQLAPGDDVKAREINMVEEGRDFFNTFKSVVSKVRSPGDQEDHLYIKEIHEVVVGDMPSKDEKIILADYLDSIIAETNRIDIKGISSSPG
ncbi:MAG: hypothetical protein GY737_16895 [Desulfobacteraceae bacterium]|nr:hypothetical protein [Desulfobacteraceae bacterium]